MGGQLAHPQTGEPQTRETKIWETVDDEYVFWEDILIDPVRQHSDVSWIAFRHLFDQQSLLTGILREPRTAATQAQNKLSDLFKWTEETAAKSPVGGGPAIESGDPSRRCHPQSDGLGDLEQIDQGNHLADPRERRHLVARRSR